MPAYCTEQLCYSRTGVHGCRLVWKKPRLTVNATDHSHKLKSTLVVSFFLNKNIEKQCREVTKYNKMAIVKLFVFVRLFFLYVCGLDACVCATQTLLYGVIIMSSKICSVCPRRKTCYTHYFTPSFCYILILLYVYM